MNWFVLVLCLAASFLFSGTEAGILSLNRLRLRHLARQRDRAAVRLQQVLEQPAHLLVTVLIVTSLLNILALVLLANALVAWFGWSGYCLTLLVALPLFLLAVELLPKAVFRRIPYQKLAALAILLDGASTILKPGIDIGSFVAKNVLRLQRPREIFLAREDLKYVTSEIERMGLLSSIERQMIHNVVDFRSVKVSDVMVHVSAVVTVRPETTIEQLLDVFRRSRFDRYPVVNQLGNIIGVVTVFDLIVDRPAFSTVRDYLRRILTVSPDEPAALVLRRLRASPIGLAAVVDVSGHTVGIVSVEDLVNPLVKVRDPQEEIDTSGFAI
jgi:CBS domain containing-hemolysin-like protein